MEAAFCALSVRDGKAPPTRNLFHSDCGADVDLIAQEARTAKIYATLSNSIGFGGSNFHMVLEEHGATRTEPAWDGSVEILALCDQGDAALAEYQAKRDRFAAEYRFADGIGTTPMSAGVEYTDDDGRFRVDHVTTRPPPALSPASAMWLAAMPLSSRRSMSPRASA